MGSRESVISVSLPLPRTHAAAASSDQRVIPILQAELAELAAMFEPHLMRRGGGWLEGAVTFEVESISRTGGSLNAGVRVTYRTQCVPGCGTSAVGTDDQLHMAVRLDLAAKTAVAHLPAE